MRVFWEKWKNKVNTCIHRRYWVELKIFSAIRHFNNPEQDTSQAHSQSVRSLVPPIRVPIHWITLLKFFITFLWLVLYKCCQMGQYSICWELGASDHRCSRFTSLLTSLGGFLATCLPLPGTFSSTWPPPFYHFLATVHSAWNWE
jgi:hypothetical protein